METSPLTSYLSFASLRSEADFLASHRTTPLQLSEGQKSCVFEFYPASPKKPRTASEGAEHCSPQAYQGRVSTTYNQWYV